MCDILELYKCSENEIEKTNEKYREKLENSSSDNPMDNVSFIKLFFSEYLLEDLKLLATNSENNFLEPRHVNLMIRNITEQTIEFIYLLKNPEQINNFMGMSLEDDILDKELEENNNLIDLYKKICGNKRYKEKKKSVHQMAKDIKEEFTENNQLCLYDMYKLLSDSSHSSYFNSILSDFGSIENNLPSEDDTFIRLLPSIVNKFISKYK